MKQLLLLLAMLLVTCYGFSQTAGTDYAFTTDAKVLKWDEATQKPTEDLSICYRAPRGAIYTIKEKVSFIKDKKEIKGYRIQFWRFGSSNQQNKGLIEDLAQQKKLGKTEMVVKVIDNAENDKMFFITEDEAKNSATSDFRKPKGVFKVDGIVLPVKLRFKNSKGGTFDFGQSISVGPAVNFNLNYGGPFSERSLSFILGANISSIGVDSSTVPTVVKSKTTLLGLSPFAGLNAEYHGVSLGIIGGFDILSGKAQENWVYRGCPWIGFTIGTSLISTTKKANN